MGKLAISYEPGKRDEIDKTKILLEDGDGLVYQIRKGLIAASVPGERIIPAFDGRTGLDILSRQNVGNALFGHMPSCCGGEVEVEELLRQFAEQDRQIVFWLNDGVAEAVRRILQHAEIQDKYTIIQKCGGIDPRHLEEQMRHMFPEIFPSLIHRFNSSLRLRVRKALARSAYLRADARVAR